MLKEPDRGRNRTFRADHALTVCCNDGDGSNHGGGDTGPASGCVHRPGGRNRCHGFFDPDSRSADYAGRTMCTASDRETVCRWRARDNSLPGEGASAPTLQPGIHAFLVFHEPCIPCVRADNCRNDRCASAELPAVFQENEHLYQNGYAWKKERLPSCLDCDFNTGIYHIPDAYLRRARDRTSADISQHIPQLSGLFGDRHPPAGCQQQTCCRGI